MARLESSEENMAVFFRAITYAALFIGFVLIYVPANILSWSGIERPAALGVQQVAGMVIGTIGARLALAGAAFFYESWPLLSYTGSFLLIAHLLVIFYEEPTLRRTFGQEYEAYCRQTKRWWPRLLHLK
jgi:hypothetical protein